MKRTLKLIGTVILILVFVVTLIGCGGKKVPENEGILGTWYSYWGEGTDIYIFYEDGTYLNTIEEFLDEAENYEVYSYDEDASTLYLEPSCETAVVKELTDEKLVFVIEAYEETYTLYRDEATAKAESPYYLTSDEYTDTIMDEEGFCIADGVLYAYRGTAEEVTVPEGVTEIYMEAFAGDYNHGVNLKKVTVPGSVKVIRENAFAFTNADVIVIEEGVEEIESNAFMDSYIDEITFPASIETIGANILETEEGLMGTKLYVVAGSAMEAYLKDYPPYGQCEVIAK